MTMYHITLLWLVSTVYRLCYCKTIKRHTKKDIVLPHC